jgi:trimeric autotransporter adhesin
MFRNGTRISALLWLICIAVSMVAGQSTPSSSNPVVPTLVNFSGTLNDVDGKPLTSLAGVTFLLYADSQGGAPLWMETQNVQPNRAGRYTVALGSTTSQGLPTSVFASGEARWLGVQVQGQEEQPRVMLLAVPYALKAADAETIGGLPPSAFMLANQGTESGAKGASAPASASAQKNSVPPANPNVTGKGVVDFIPMWDTTSDIIDSMIFQKSSEIGINTTTPAATLDVNGKADIRDTLTLFPKSTDSTLAISGTTFKIDQTGKVTFITGQKFPGTGTITGVTTASGSGLSGGGTSGTLSLKVPAAGITNAMLANSKITLNANSAGGITTPGAMTLGSTYTIGLKPCSANQVLQYVGTAWACSNAGTGTLTGVTAGTDLTGGGSSGTVTLNLDTTKVPQLTGNNNFAGNLNVTGALGVGTTAPALQLDVSLGDAVVRGTDNYHQTGDVANLFVGDTNTGIEAIFGSGLTFNTYLAPAAMSIFQASGDVAIGNGGEDSGFQFFVGGNKFSAVGVDGAAAPAGSDTYGGDGIQAYGGTGDGSDTNDGIGGIFVGGSHTLGGNGDGLVADAGSGDAGYFGGDVNVTGNVSKSGGSFKIDHPLDPANKYLYHSFVESPDMMNIYNGNVVTDANGDALVPLPDWFETLNRDFRYQLTVVGQFAQAIVASKVAHNQFSIKTDKPNVEVSWQVTGIRQDAWANAHRIPVEEHKNARERGHYIHPELFGAPEEASIAWARHPETMKRIRVQRAKTAALASH